VTVLASQRHHAKAGLRYGMSFAAPCYLERGAMRRMPDDGFARAVGRGSPLQSMNCRRCWQKIGVEPDHGSIKIRSKHRVDAIHAAKSTTSHVVHRRESDLAGIARAYNPDCRLSRWWGSGIGKTGCAGARPLLLARSVMVLDSACVHQHGHAEVILPTCECSLDLCGRENQRAITDYCRVSKSVLMDILSICWRGADSSSKFCRTRRSEILYVREPLNVQA